jgi:hypothetical protein
VGIHLAGDKRQELKSRHGFQRANTSVCLELGRTLLVSALRWRVLPAPVHAPAPQMFLMLPALGLSLVIMFMPLTMLSLLARCNCCQPMLRGLGLLSITRWAAVLRGELALTLAPPTRSRVLGASVEMVRYFPPAVVMCR